MPKNPMRGSTMRSGGGDQNAGEQSKSTDLAALDAKYHSHPDREGINESHHDFHGGERVETGASPRNSDEKPRQSFEKPLTTGTASEYSEQSRQDRVDRDQRAWKNAAAEDNKNADPFKPFDPRE